MTLFDETGVPDGPALETPGDRAATVRVKLVVAYDGSTFHGFAVNRDVVTVAGTLQQAIETILRHPVQLVGAGRTDRGVHAWGQVVSFDMAAGAASPVELRHGINELCGGRIVVRDAAVAAPDFDARFSARSRLYRYTVRNQSVPDPFDLRTAWWIDEPLDLRTMALACDPLIGTHDFSSFCRRPRPAEHRLHLGEPSLVRRVIDARWTAFDERGPVLRFEIEAQAFCHQMVRSIVGTMIEIGRGKKRAGDMTAILRTRDRRAAGQLAPPHGLCLWEVRY